MKKEQNTLWNEMMNINNVTATANGDKAYISTLNPLLDFMFKAGTMRNTDTKDIVSCFTRAFNYNPIYAVRLAFYIRDIRGGQGERRVFRLCMMALAKLNEEMYKKVLNFIPEYGRWDDLIDLYFNVPVQKSEALGIISKQLISDIQNLQMNKPISLLAKWLPSENASSKETITRAKHLRKFFELTSQEYRKTLSKMRKYLDIVERKITLKEYDQINYNTVPSLAMMKYRNVFNSYDEERYNQYLNSLVKNDGTAKVNAATLYPFDIVSKVLHNYNCSAENAKLFDSMWKALPDFFGNKFNNALVVADVSGSMSGNPLNVCLGLAIYIAERNKGLFHNKFITFSARPVLEEIRGNTIINKCMNLERANWDMNTDISKVFELILKSSINANLDQKDIPEMIYIISDMQFDSCCDKSDRTTFEYWSEKFNEHGYKLPTIVFWNVSSYGNDNVPITVNDSGAILCSGYSPSICKYIMESDVTDTMKLVENIVNGARYNVILAD